MNSSNLSLYFELTILLCFWKWTISSVQRINRFYPLSVYSGYIPRLNFRFGSTYGKDATNSISDFVSNRNEYDSQQNSLNEYILAQPPMIQSSTDEYFRQKINAFKDKYSAQTSYLRKYQNICTSKGFFLHNLKGNGSKNKFFGSTSKQLSRFGFRCRFLTSSPYSFTTKFFFLSFRYAKLWFECDVLKVKMECDWNTGLVLVSLFNGISAFVDYLMPKPFS